MEVIDGHDSIKIQYDSNDISHQSVYNREYFLLLNLKIIEDEVDKKTGGVHQYLRKKVSLKKKKDIVDSTIDRVDLLAESKTEGVRNSIGNIIEDTEKGVSYISGILSDISKKSEIIIKKNDKYELITLEDEINLFYDRSKTIFNFDSGYTYNEYSNVVKDLYIQMSYLFFLNMKISVLDFKRVFKINGRYVLLENNITEKDEHESRESYFLELEKKMVELTGKQYEKGQYERDMKMIEGTEIYKYKRGHFI
jgi:hypothetical protein